jgi:hypothetical protein
LTIGPANSPVRQLKIAYTKSSTEPTFLKVATIDIGWLWLYILIYLPVLTFLRVLLKVA